MTEMKTQLRNYTLRLLHDSTKFKTSFYGKLALDLRDEILSACWVNLLLSRGCKHYLSISCRPCHVGSPHIVSHLIVSCHNGSRHNGSRKILSLARPDNCQPWTALSLPPPPPTPPHPRVNCCPCPLLPLRLRLVGRRQQRDQDPMVWSSIQSCPPWPYGGGLGNDGDGDTAVAQYISTL